MSSGEGPRSDALRIIGRLAGAGVVAGVLAALIAFSTLGMVGVGARNGANWFEAIPGDLQTPPVAQRSVILAADGSKLATFYYENRVDVPLSKVAPIMRKAILAIEDSRFYEHGGLDLKGTARALVSNLAAGQVTQGGSGITQQYVKNLLVETADTDAERRSALATTPARKLRELRYAVAMEKQLTKDQILERYLNIAYFGSGAYGVEAASRHYFGHSAAKLSLPEAALLAGIVRYPYAYDPTVNPKLAEQRRNTVLQRMSDLRWLPADTASAAERTPLRLHVTSTPNGCVESSAPFFCDYVEREILGNPIFGKTVKARTRLLQRGGLVIRTTLDPGMQRAAQRAVDHYVPPKNSSHKAAAEALVEPGTGQVKAMAVDRELGPSEKRGKTWVNFAADSDHGTSIGMQAGSTFKIFTLAAALDQGMPFGHRLMAPDHYTPTGFRDCDGKPVGSTESLGNAGDGEGGRTFSLVTGTWHSVNTFFLRLEKEVGLCDTVKMAEKLGMRRADGSALQQYPSFTLGFNTVSPLRVAAAYAAFGARGEYCAPIVLTKITDTAGHELKVPSAHCHQAIDKGVADAVNHVLRGVLTQGTAAGEGIGRPAAGKTGTVDGFSSAWFAGYTPDLASAVWVGDPRGGYKHPLTNVCLGGRCFGEVFGADIPAPIWRETMLGALRDVPEHDFHSPPGDYYSEGSGEDRVQVPDVLGLSPSAAADRLRAAGFDVSFGPRIASDAYGTGTVARTSPGGGASVEPGATVTIYVSKGAPQGPKPPVGPTPPGGPVEPTPPGIPTPPIIPPVGGTRGNNL
ncbi:penicillin-binding protein [Actinoallomurus rhizosphaericola]|uniref:penicillin-binding protein n=1 Tax=Actinoallomurus rhizosphaericola TaxID=2952536 RepID=UPI00209067AF|nr:transglycosylase domain-containing protein [Actinoallomurus rhizosphaericola]MCO5992774.1 penicillin-binding protein [Actinoallomurus rhizosphaericola]